MAWAQVQYRIRQDEELAVDVGLDSDSPDAATDCVNRARALFRETLADVFDVVERE